MDKFCVVFSLFLSISSGQIAFPEDDIVPSRPNSNNQRFPYFAPGKCPVDQLYYPGDQENDWICDCSPRFVYYPAKDRCYALYKQGPCKEGEYLILNKSEVIPKCVNNPCKNDTYVPFNGGCHKLHRTNGCPPLHMGGGTLEVNATTLQLECAPGNAAELNFIQAPAICPKGSKRSATGQCRPEF